MTDPQEKQPVSKTAMVIARGTLMRRVQLENGRLGEMLKRGNHKDFSYQAGLVDGLYIAARLTAVLDDDAEGNHGAAD